MLYYWDPRYSSNPESFSSLLKNSYRIASRSSSYLTIRKRMQLISAQDEAFPAAGRQCTGNLDHLVAHRQCDTCTASNDVRGPWGSSGFDGATNIVAGSVWKKYLKPQKESYSCKVIYFIFYVCMISSNSAWDSPHCH